MAALANRPSHLVAIEQVPLGARVPTKNPKPWEYDDSLPEPDLDSWVKISLTVQRIDSGVVDAELLRPRQWADALGLAAGRLLPIDIQELQVQGTALIRAIEPCPLIAAGEGSPVTARFVTRQVDTIVRIEVLGADGQVETIEGTTIHPRTQKCVRYEWRCPRRFYGFGSGGVTLSPAFKDAGFRVAFFLKNFAHGVFC